MDIEQILAENKDKRFVQRIYNPDKSIELGEGMTGTHLMNAEVTEDGRNVVFPSIVERDGELVNLSSDDPRDKRQAMEHAEESGGYIEFGTLDEAIEFSKTYKQHWNKKESQDNNAQSFSFNSKYLTKDDNGEYQLSPEVQEALDASMDYIGNIPIPNLGAIPELPEEGHMGKDMLEYFKGNIMGRRDDSLTGEDKAYRFMNPSLMYDDPEITYAEIDPSGKGLLKKPVKTITESRNKIFDDLANQQRDLPESAMIKVQKKMGGGVLSVVTEHAGDLVHRMSQKPDFFRGGFEWVKEKVDRLSTYLNRPYGFEKELGENIASKARIDGRDISVVEKEISDALSNFGREHEKLVPYNRVQYLSQSLNEYIGKQKWDAARALVGKLKTVTDRGRKNWEKVALEFNGKPYTVEDEAKYLGLE